MFEFNPDLVGEDDNDAGEDVLIIQREKDEDEVSLFYWQLI